MKKRLIIPVESGKSKPASQQTVNQWKEQMRGLPTGRHKKAGKFLP
jgi:hypothetical protein